MLSTDIQDLSLDDAPYLPERFVRVLIDIARDAHILRNWMRECQMDGDLLINYLALSESLAGWVVAVDPEPAENS